MCICEHGWQILHGLRLALDEIYIKVGPIKKAFDAGSNDSVLVAIENHHFLIVELDIIQLRGVFSVQS